MTDEPDQLQLLASETFSANELHRVVTFLNQCLKSRGLVFGLGKAGSNYSIRIYTGPADSESHLVAEGLHPADHQA
ncbi:MAG: DUF4264 family protein [Limnochordia bacterium]|jgi:hypothetical protein